LTHCSSPKIWLEEGRIFYCKLRSRGYPPWFLQTVFKEVTWKRRNVILYGHKKSKNNAFFDSYRGCVLTLRNAPEWPLLKRTLNMELTELVMSTNGDIFPPRVFLAQSNARSLASFIKR
jgi:hypothetical protein